MLRSQEVREKQADPGDHDKTPHGNRIVGENIVRVTEDAAAHTASE
jgi:hypothetical protein